MKATTPPAADASVHMAMLRHIQGQLHSGQRRVSWNVQQAITE